VIESDINFNIPEVIKVLRIKQISDLLAAILYLFIPIARR